MKRINTVLKKEEFSEIIKKRHVYREVGFAFYINQRKFDYSRVGISVATKLGNAVKRNLAKRQIREMVAQIYDWQESFDTIIVIYKEYDVNNFTNNQKCFNNCYKKVKIKDVTN